MSSSFLPACEFETTVYPVIERYARMSLGNDAEMVSKALVLGWYYWSRGPRDLPASVWARAAVRAVRSGRDLPGVRDGRRRDALDDAWQGAGMAGMIDPAPGPAQVVSAREEYAGLLDGLSAGQRRMVEAVAAGTFRTDRLAAALGVTPARVSQMRREILAKLKR